MKYEYGELEITAYTDYIIRVFSDFSGIRPDSFAVEGDKKTDTNVTMEEKDGCVTLSTEKLVVNIQDEAKVDFYDRQGRALCMDYRGERKAARELTLEMKQFVEQEGHVLTGKDAGHRIQCVKKLDAGDCFYGMGDKTGFLLFLWGG